MKLNRIFYDSYLNFKSISKKRVVLSILLGLISAFIIYSFYYCLREADRMMFPDFENRPLIISESQRYLQNLFFAAISLVLGNSLAINFLFSRPQNVFSRQNIKRGRILNDQAFLSFNFIHWFTKIWFLFCVFAWQTMGSEFTKTFLLPSVLLISVLYLDSWKTLIQVIKKNRFKIQFIHLVIFITLTFLLSRINVIDYKSFDRAILKANPTIDVPSSQYSDIKRWSGYESLVFKMDFSDNKKVVILNFENERIELNDVSNEIEEHKKYSFYGEPARIFLRADKNIPIKSIKNFEYELQKIDVFKIIYEIKNKDEKTAFFGNNQIEHYISPNLQKEINRVDNIPHVPDTFLIVIKNLKTHYI